jgi:hypothetical protein
LLELVTVPRAATELVDAVYAAAFLDGEGSVNLTANSKGNGVRVQVILVNTHMPILEWYRDHWGGAIYRHGKMRSKWDNRRQPAFLWALTGPKALPFLEDILPHLKIKRPQTENAIAFLQLKAQRKRRRGLTETEKAEDAHYLATHKSFNLTRGRRKPNRTSAEVLAALGPGAQWS